METPMTDHSKIRQLIRNPKAMMDLQATGRLPQTPERDDPSPLARLLNSLTPRELLQITSVTVCPELGYQCRNTFRNAQQTLNWLYPDPINGATYPADAVRDRRFESRRPTLSIEDLAKHASVPDHIKAR